MTSRTARGVGRAGGREKERKIPPPHPDRVFEGRQRDPGSIARSRSPARGGERRNKATNTNTNNKNGKATLVGQLISGAKKHFTNANQTITLGGASITIDAAIDELQSFVDNRAAVVAAQAAAKTKLLAERAELPALNAFIKAFIGFVRLTFGPQADVLADFGLAPAKAPAPLTAEKKAVAAAKRKATRDARGTKGAKAKKVIHGNVNAELVVTSAAPAAGGSAPATTTSTLPKA